MFFKVLFYILSILVLIGVLGKTNYNTSLYKKDMNVIEFIFPIWDWGHPWFYAQFDDQGLSLTPPDDLLLRFIVSKYEKQEKIKETVCKEKGVDSEECENEDIALEDLKTAVEDEQANLKDIIDEKGEDAKLSHSFEQEKFQF